MLAAALAAVGVAVVLVVLLLLLPKLRIVVLEVVLEGTSSRAAA